MEKMTFDIVIHKNYGGVGLEFDNGKQASTINAHWSVWQPNLGFGSMMGCGHLHSNYFPFSPVQYGECDFRLGDRYGNVVVFTTFIVCWWLTPRLYTS